MRSTREKVMEEKAEKMEGPDRRLNMNLIKLDHWRLRAKYALRKGRITKDLAMVVKF